MTLEGYSPLFATIVTSSIWSYDHATRIVWITLLAMADANNYVAASVPGLARLANVSMDEVERAIKILSEPDPHSRTERNQGRRIGKADGGWIILNRDMYKAKIREIGRRQRKAEYEKKRRKQLKERGQ